MMEQSTDQIGDDLFVKKKVRQVEVYLRRIRSPNL